MTVNLLAQLQNAADSEIAKPATTTTTKAKTPMTRTAPKPLPFTRDSVFAIVGRVPTATPAVEATDDTPAVPAVPAWKDGLAILAGVAKGSGFLQNHLGKSDKGTYLDLLKHLRKIYETRKGENVSAIASAVNCGNQHPLLVATIAYVQGFEQTRLPQFSSSTGKKALKATGFEAVEVGDLDDLLG